MLEKCDRDYRHHLLTGASGFLVPADELFIGIHGKKCRQAHLKKELSCLTKNSLRLQGIHGWDLILYFCKKKFLTGLTGFTRFIRILKKFRAKTQKHKEKVSGVFDPPCPIGHPPLVKGGMVGLSLSFLSPLTRGIQGDR